MKKIIKNLIFVIVVISTTISCTESDNAVDQLLNDVDISGAIIRSLTRPLDFMIVANPDMNKVDFVIEVQEGNGDIYPDFKEVRVYSRFYEDQNLVTPIANTEGVAFDELLIQTISADTFVIGDNGLPTATVFYNSEDVAVLNIDAVYVSPSFIETRLELEMNDGTIYSKENVSSAIGTGVYFEAPFSYVSPIIVN